MVRNYSERLTACCLILLSAALGLLVHPFYDWTGADQSRPVALLWQVPLSISVALGLFCFALPWIPIQRGIETPRRPIRFSLRLLLLATGVIAFLLTLGIHYPNVFAGIAFLATVLMVVYCWRRFPGERWSIIALLATMYLPYVWFPFKFNPGMTSYFIWIASAPAFLPSYLVLRFLTHSTQESTFLAVGMALTSLEIAMGLALIHLGPKRGFAFVVLVLIVSLFGALGLDALLRM